jgi:hypothetical protein
MVIPTNLEDRTTGRNKKYGNIILKDGNREMCILKNINIEGNMSIFGLEIMGER